MEMRFWEYVSKKKAQLPKLMSEVCDAPGRARSLVTGR